MEIQDLIEVANAAIKLKDSEAKKFIEVSNLETDEAWKCFYDSIRKLEASGYKGHLYSWKDHINEVVAATGICEE